jgi:hypothetical protein
VKVRAARRLRGTRVGARPTVVHMSLAGRIKTICPDHALETQSGKNMEALRSEAALQQIFHSGCRWRKRGTITTRPSIVETRDARVSGSNGQRTHFGYMQQERKRGKVERMGRKARNRGGRDSVIEVECTQHDGLKPVSGNRIAKGKPLEN